MNWEAIRIEFEETDITMKALAEKHGVKPATLRSRKNREKWVQRNAKKVATKNATQRKNVATQKAVKELSDNGELTEPQKQFCLLYLKYFNATKAYKEAYDCSYKAANKNAWALMVNKGIQKEMKRLKEAQSSDLYIDSLYIKQGWLKQAFADVNDFLEYGSNVIQVQDKYGNPLIDPDGNPVIYKDSFVNFKDMDEIDGTLIKEVRMGKDGPVIQLYDKQKAMQELLKLMSNDGPGGTEKVVFLSSEEQMEQWIAENGESNDG